MILWHKWKNDEQCFQKLSTTKFLIAFLVVCLWNTYEVVLVYQQSCFGECVGKSRLVFRCRACMCIGYFESSVTWMENVPHLQRDSSQILLTSWCYFGQLHLTGRIVICVSDAEVLGKKTYHVNLCYYFIFTG